MESNDINNWTAMPDGSYDHDCGGDGSPGLTMVGFKAVDGFNVAHWECLSCGRPWWLIDGTYYNPYEWDSAEEIFARSRS